MVGDLGLLWLGSELTCGRSARDRAQPRRNIRGFLRGHSSAPQSAAIIGKTMLGRQRCESLISVSTPAKAPTPKPVHSSP